MADVTPVDFETPTGQVRGLIHDTVQKAYDGKGTPVRYRLSDGEIGMFLALNSGGVYGAAADALNSLASNEVLISKVIRTEDLQTDGAKVAAELRLEAIELRKRQVNADYDAELESAFEVVPSTYPYENPEW